jgi:hypothetical protein
MMKLDISTLLLDELFDLNRRIRVRIQELLEQETHRTMNQFFPGQRVCFAVGGNGRVIKGHIVRLNRKTVSIHDDSHGQWRISPEMLRPLEDVLTQERTIAPEKKNTCF